MGVDGYDVHGKMNCFEYVNGCLIYGPVQFIRVVVWLLVLCALMLDLDDI